MKQATFGSLFSFHRRPPLSHDIALDAQSPGRSTGGASAAVRPRRVPGPLRSQEANHQYMRRPRRHKGGTGRKGAPAATAGRIPGFCRDFAQARAVKRAGARRLAEIGQPG